MGRNVRDKYKKKFKIPSIERKNNSFHTFTWMRFLALIIKTNPIKLIKLTKPQAKTIK